MSGRRSGRLNAFARVHALRNAERIQDAMELPQQERWRLDIHHQTPVIRGEEVTLPGFDVHQIAGNVLMNGGNYGQEGSGSESAVHGRVQA